MCGIAGFLELDGRPAARALVERMTATIAHRGPDGDGFHLDGPVALGHRRLAIIDVAGGAQPLSNEDGSIWVTYNGELYGEESLRAELQAKGHRYRTDTDTETLVHLYEEEGPDFLGRLNGMFALALWDAPRRRLLLARDPMGQKPLYWSTAGGRLRFGSEPKALLADPGQSRRLDRAGLARYLFYEYLPAPHTIWQGMSKLPRGHRLMCENGRVVVDRYPDPDPPGGDHNADPGRFWEDLVDSVARHRRSDVPLGVFLSGGLDSSSVAAAACARMPADRVETYSIGFDDPSYDESDHARAVAARLGTDHRARRFALDDALRLLPEVAAWSDEPFGDASILPTHLLCRFARERVTVALGGDGADELLAGYPTFALGRVAGWFRSSPESLQRLAGRAVATLPVRHGNFSLDFKAKQFLRGAPCPAPLAHQRWLGSFSGPELLDLLAEAPAVDVEAELLDRAAGLAQSGLAADLALYQEMYLPEDILTKVDRASMACSLEVRAPFLDRELVARMHRLPERALLRGGKGKRILRDAVAGRLPPQILTRPKKGFGIPVSRWLNEGLAATVDRLLDPARLAREGTFRPAAVARLLAEHRSGAANHRKPLWTLVMFQLWRESWLEGAD